MTTVNVPPRIWREDFKIHSYEIGPSGFATPQAICRFIQEAASNHAALLNVSAEAMAMQDQMWVLSCLSLRMQCYPRWRETMEIATWPVISNSAVRGLRDLTLLDNHNQQQPEIIGQASTLWLLLDKDSRRPLKIPSGLKLLASPGHSPYFLTPVKESDFVIDAVSVYTKDFLVRGSDIDWNLHVNNVSYLEWALETLPSSFRLQNKIAELDISFVAEGKFDHLVAVQTFISPDDQGCFLHKIVDKASQSTLALLRSTWRPARNFDQPT